MDVRQLEYFVEVARQRSFRKAADALFVSQPAISKTIKELEGELGVTLLYRNTKSVELTDNGQAILEQAQQIISSFQNIRAQLEEVSKLRTGKINIGLPPITGVTAMAYVLGAFKTEFPNIEIILHEFGSKKIEQLIQEGMLDAGIICMSEKTDQIYDIIRLVKDPLQIIVHNKHWLARKEVVSYSDIGHEHLVLYNNDFGLHDMIMERFQHEGVNPHVIFKTSQRELMTQTVAAGLGVAMLPSKICASLDSDNITSIPIANPQLYLQLALARKKDRYMSHALRELLSYAKEHLADIDN